MIAARSVSVIVRGTISAGGRGGSTITASLASAAGQDRDVERRALRRAGAREARRSRDRRLATEQPEPIDRRLLEAPPGVAMGAIQEQPGAQLGLGIRLVLGEHARRRLGPRAAASPGS